ncbi:DUF3253 domain-containing protein [Pelagibius sp.]|uniref:DUF3253 domain-containing protein n=1 Tax=Pelagibius sp. TaxID=1931238 RepID=UPI00260D1A3E|nr:DUF3253 domain-containing protein [Pelagibius sp.]
MTDHQDTQAAQGVALDPVARLILDLLAAAPGVSLTPAQVAKAFAEPRRRRNDPPDLWRRYLSAVRQQALYLARSGRIVILRRGQPQDPNAPIKGVVRLALPPLA